MNVSVRRGFFLLLLLLGACLAGGCRPHGQEAATVQRSRLLMGTVVEITAIGPERARLDRAVDAAFAEMGRIETLMSSHRPDSDVARLSAAGETIVAAETATVIALGRDVAIRSGGAFDMGLGRLKALWDIEGEKPHLPSAAEIRTALAGTGPDDLRLEGRTVAKADPRLAVDLGGIAKGYAVDRAAAVLAARGVRHAAVNAGGDMRLLGDHEGRRWRIGIQHPRHSEALLATLDLADCAVVTSGDYERYFERDGVRYHHLFDPRSGRPARLCQAVTVVAPRAALADALATAAFVLGPEAGLELLRDYPEVEGLIVAADGSGVTTDGLAGQVQWR